MNRGILKITNNEASELLKNLNLANYLGTPLGNKLGSIDLNNKEIVILLSNDEIEKMLDEIGMPDPITNPTLHSAVNKMNQLILKPGLHDL